MARLTGIDVSVFNVGGSNLLAELTSADVIAQTDFADVTPLILTGIARAPVKQQVQIKSALLSTKSGGLRVTHLDVSALTLAGVDFRSVMREVLFEGSVQHEETSGIGDEWAWPVAVHKDYRAKFLMAVDTESSSVLVGKAFGELSGKAVPISFTINGTVITLAMQLEQFEHKLSAVKVQIWEISLVGSSPLTGAYPTAPTGTSSLLAHAFNAPGAALAVAAADYSGNFIIENFGFQFTSGSAVKSWYDFASQGVVG